MKKWIKIYDFKQHGPEPQEKGAARVINIHGKRICLVRTEEGYFGLENRCPHAGAWLGEGWCEQDHVVCPVHRFRYHVKTGNGAPGQGDRVDTFPVKEDKDGIYIAIRKNPWWKIW
jgi:nitrite reductase/ring-hydroxylating ferredoxin subunit